MMKDRCHDEAMSALYKDDPALAAAALDAVLEDGDQAELMLMLRQLAGIYGGISKVAASSGLNTTQLYRTLSEQGNPELRSLSALLRAMGLRLSVCPVSSDVAGSQA